MCICFGGDNDGGKHGGVRLDVPSYFLIDGLPPITHASGFVKRIWALHTPSGT